MIARAITNLKKLGPVASFDALRTLRQDADAGADYSPSIGAAADTNSAAKQSALGNQAVAGAIRDAMATADPQMAAANANFSIWQKAANVVNAAEALNKGRGPSTSSPLTANLATLLLGAAGTSAGAHFLGWQGSSAGTLTGGYLGAVLDNAVKRGLTTKVATARVLDTLASAIRDGNAPIVAKSIADLGTITGTVVPTVSQQFSPSGLGPINTGPQAPINVAMNAGGGQ